MKRALIFCLLLGGCRGNGGQSLVLSGTLEWTEHALGARAPGRVDWIDVEESQAVKTGETLALLDRFAQAKKDYERAQRLFQQGGGSEQSVEQTRLAMEDLEVKSPLDGVVLVKVHEKGNVVPAGSPLLIVGDPRKAWVRVFVPENRIGRIKVGQPAALRFDGFPRDVQGRVSSVASQAEFTPRNVQTKEERVTQTFAVKVTVDDPDPNLRPGLSADVTLPLAP